MAACLEYIRSDMKLVMCFSDGHNAFGPFCRFQHGYEPDQHLLALNQCWKVMLTMQSQIFDPKVHFCPPNQHAYEGTHLS